MGRQINFYITDDDLREIESKLKTLDAVFVNYFASTKSPILFDSLLCPSYTGPGWFSPCVTHLEFLGGLIMKEVPAQRYWVIDKLRSPVIELIRGTRNIRKFEPGRVWYESSYYGEHSVLIKKPERFLMWAESVFRSIRKMLSYNHELRVYMGPHAAKAGHI